MILPIFGNDLRCRLNATSYTPRFSHRYLQIGTNGLAHLSFWNSFSKVHDVCRVFSWNNSNKFSESSCSSNIADSHLVWLSNNFKFVILALYYISSFHLKLVSYRPLSTTFGIQQHAACRDRIDQVLVFRPHHPSNTARQTLQCVTIKSLSPVHCTTSTVTQLSSSHSQTFLELLSDYPVDESLV